MKARDPVGSVLAAIYHESIDATNGIDVNQLGRALSRNDDVIHVFFDLDDVLAQLASLGLVKVRSDGRWIRLTALGSTMGAELKCEVERARQGAPARAREGE